jgi:hypothetical protein
LLEERRKRKRQEKRERWREETERGGKGARERVGGEQGEGMLSQVVK